jgi:hypothetical protein
MNGLSQAGRRTDRGFPMSEYVAGRVWLGLSEWACESGASGEGVHVF